MSGWDAMGFEEDSAEVYESFEDSAVRAVLRKVGLERSISYLKSQCRDSTGSDYLSFPWFHSAHPLFPVALSTAKLYGLSDRTASDLITRFTKTPIFKAFMDFVEDDGILLKENHAGLIFRWRAKPMMVIHTYPREDEMVDSTKHWTRVSRVLGSGSGRIVVSIEPLDALLYNVAENWKPEAD
jgi:hypothetical protein